MAEKYGAHRRCEPFDNRQSYLCSDIVSDSQLPRLYDELLNHPNTPDDLRRVTDSKLLRHKQQYLHALPATGKLAPLKAQIASELEGLVNGAIVLGIPDELAWTLYIEGKDCDTIGQPFSFSLRHMLMSCLIRGIRFRLITPVH